DEHPLRGGDPGLRPLVQGWGRRVEPGELERAAVRPVERNEARRRLGPLRGHLEGLLDGAQVLGARALDEGLASDQQDPVQLAPLGSIDAQRDSEEGRGQGHGGDRRHRQRDSSRELHGASRRYPIPLTVTIIEPWAPSFSRRFLTWTSTTLDFVSKLTSHTFESSSVRDTTRPA